MKVTVPGGGEEMYVFTCEMLEPLARPGFYAVNVAK
jgi:hypothetical protein